VCTQARSHGRPYARCGCSLYVHELKLLIDTPEDIAQALNNSDVREVERVFYSHWDPDHTMGMRVFEQMRLDWLAASVGEKCTRPIEVYALPNVMDDINGIRSKYGPMLDYYELEWNLIERKLVQAPLVFGDVRVTFVPVGHATVFVFEMPTRKWIYAPCDVKPFPKDILLHGADLLIIGNTMPDGAQKGGFLLQSDNPIRRDLFSMTEIVALKREYGVKHVVMTHIEEEAGKSYDDYLELEKEYDNINFSVDGMTITL